MIDKKRWDFSVDPNKMIWSTFPAQVLSSLPAQDPVKTQASYSFSESLRAIYESFAAAKKLAGKELPVTDCKLDRLVAHPVHAVPHCTTVQTTPLCTWNS